MSDLTALPFSLRWSRRTLWTPWSLSSSRMSSSSTSLRLGTVMTPVRNPLVGWGRTVIGTVRTPFFVWIDKLSASSSFRAFSTSFICTSNLPSFLLFTCVASPNRDMALWTWKGLMLGCAPPPKLSTNRETGSGPGRAGGRLSEAS